MKNKKLITWLSGALIVIAIFTIGNYTGRHAASNVAIHVTSNADLVTDAQLAPFWKVWKILDEKHVNAASTTSQDKIWGAIKGLASSENDPYTVFFPPVESEQFKNDITGNFEGVGMEIGIKDNVLTVVAPIKGSPAERAGVKSGDKILKINDQITNDLGVEKAVRLIRGPRGTSVRISIYREGIVGTIEKTLVRDVIEIPTIETEKKNGVFIIRLFSFTSQAPDLFRKALREFIAADTNKLIIDLRSNPGGYLDAAWDIASWFLPAGKIVVTEDFGKNGSPDIYRSKGYNIFSSNLKLIILIDQGSASASEILAGALREHGVATLVGSKSYGKGSVQELITITPETSLKVTVARWLTPQGHNLSSNGLVPDVEVAATSTSDTALAKAIEILNK